MNSEAVTRSTFVTRLTSSAPAAIAVLEVTGPDAVSLVMQCWEPASRRTLKRSEIRYGKWLGGGKACGMGVSPVTPSFESSDRRDAYPTGYLTGEDIVVCLTGENTIELHCHGGSLQRRESSTILRCSAQNLNRSTSDRVVNKQTYGRRWLVTICFARPHR